MARLAVKPRRDRCSCDGGTGSWHSGNSRLAEARSPSKHGSCFMRRSPTAARSGADCGSTLGSS
jgi:hypothetical protein